MSSLLYKKLILYIRQDRAHMSNLRFGAKGQCLYPSISSQDTFWLTLYNLITILENLQRSPVYEVGGLCICLVTYFHSHRTLTTLFNVGHLRSLPFPKNRLYLQPMTIYIIYQLIDYMIMLIDYVDNRSMLAFLYLQ